MSDQQGTVATDATDGRWLCAACLRDVATDKHWYFLPCSHVLCYLCFDAESKEKATTASSGVPSSSSSFGSSSSSSSSPLHCTQKCSLDDDLECHQQYVPTVNVPGGVCFFENLVLGSAATGSQLESHPDVDEEQNNEIFAPVLATIQLRINELKLAIAGMRGAVAALNQRRNNRAEEVRKHYDEIILQLVSCGAQPEMVNEITRERDDVIDGFLRAVPSLDADVKALRDQCDCLLLFLDRIELLGRIPYKEMRTSSLRSYLETHAKPLLEQQLCFSLSVFTSVDVEFDVFASEIDLDHLKFSHQIARIVQRRNYVHGTSTLAFSWCGRNYHVKQALQPDAVQDQIHDDHHDHRDDRHDVITPQPAPQPEPHAFPEFDDERDGGDDERIQPVHAPIARIVQYDSDDEPDFDPVNPVHIDQDAGIDATVPVNLAIDHHTDNDDFEFGQYDSDADDVSCSYDEAHDDEETESLGSREIIVDRCSFYYHSELEQLRKNGRVFSFNPSPPRPYNYNYINDVCFDNLGKLLYVIEDDFEFGPGDMHVCRTDRSGEMRKFFKRSLLHPRISEILGRKISYLTYGRFCDVTSSGDLVFFANVSIGDPTKSSDVKLTSKTDAAESDGAAIAESVEVDGDPSTLNSNCGEESKNEQTHLSVLVTCDTKGKIHRVLDISNILSSRDNIRDFTTPFFKISNFNSYFYRLGCELISFDMFGRLLWKTSAVDTQTAAGVTEFVMSEINSFKATDIAYLGIDMDGNPTNFRQDCVRIRVPREATSEERDEEKEVRIERYQRTSCVFVPSTGVDPDMIAIVSKYQVRLIDGNTGEQLRADKIIHAVSQRMRDVEWTLSYDPVAKVGLVFGQTFEKVSLWGLIATINFSVQNGSTYSEPGNDIFKLGGVTHAALDPQDNAMAVFVQNYNQRPDYDDWF